jgi:hypothetical protein
MRSSFESRHTSAAIALSAFALGVLAVFATQMAVRRVARERARMRPRKMDELMLNRRYEPRPPRHPLGADDPWEHYEDVLG